MTGVLIVMLVVALLLGGSAVLAVVLMARRGQFDDLETPAIRAVFDDDD